MQTQLVWKITYANVVTVTVPQTEELQRQPAYMRGVGTTEVRELSSRHVLIISRVAYSSYLQLIRIRYYLQQSP
jgi:hypothetical protein